MGSATATLKMLLLGDSKSAEDALKRVAHAAGVTGDEHEKMSRRATVAILGLAGAATAFGVSSVNKFKEVGSETLSLQRTMGGTVQDASRMRFAAEETGVSFEQLSKSTGILSKTLVNASASTKNNAAMIRALGFNYRDAHGRILPMSQLLPQIAERFKRMPAGAERTALALKLFGKSGKDMLPFLLRGKDGIAALEKESDKFGLTLTGKNIDALRKARASQREWNASLDGLRVQIGAQVLPIMNQLVGFIRDEIIPVIAAVTGFVQKHKDAVIIVASVIGTLVVALKAWAIAQGILNAVMEANPIVLIITALVALGVGLVMAYKHSEKFRAIVQAVFHAVAEAGKWMWHNVLKPAFEALATAWRVVWGQVQSVWNTVIRPVFDFIKQHWKLLLDLVLPGMGLILTNWRTVWGAVKAVWETVIRPAFDGIKTAAGWVKTAFEAVGRAIQTTWDTVIRPVFDFLVHAALAVFGAIVHGAADAFGWVPGIGGKLKHAASAFDQFRNDVNAALAGTQKSYTLRAHIAGDQAVIASLSNVANLINYIKNNGHVDIGVSGRGTAGRAAGGRVTAGVPYIVGERRRELFIPDNSGRIVSDPRFTAGGDGGQLQPVQVNMYLDGQKVWQSLLALKRTRRTELGLT